MEPCWTASAGPAGIFHRDCEKHNKVWNLVGQLQLVPQGFFTGIVKNTTRSGTLLDSFSWSRRDFSQGCEKQKTCSRQV
jgi:hypothetical protein